MKTTQKFVYFTAKIPPVEIVLNKVVIKSSKTINVLGVRFDHKMTWSPHISNQINKANQALHAIRLIKKYFTQGEILSLITSNFFSILYYNSEVWHLPNLKPELKQHLLSASANALKLAQRYPDCMESFINVHKSVKRATPENF